jgi:hypothetical protein
MYDWIVLVRHKERVVAYGPMDYKTAGEASRLITTPERPAELIRLYPGVVALLDWHRHELARNDEGAAT